MKITRLSDILGIIGKMAPPGLAESWDNPGLQVGDPTMEISRIMVALDATPIVIQSALSSSCQLLLTHHPLIFKPQKTISTATPQGRSIHAAIRGGLAVACMHTNYDCVNGGLNDVLAGVLGLGSCRPLRVTGSQELVKLVVFVPEEHLERVRAELLGYGEQLGAYRDCSFAAPGVGTFTSQAGSHPFLGVAGVQQRVEEVRLELLLDRKNLSRAVKTLLSAHPYEEPAFDVYPLLNEGGTTGLGRVGTLPEPVPLALFAERVAEKLRAPGLRYVGETGAMVSKVALCSGSGASLMHNAERAGADVLLTGDVKYHEALDARDLGIALIDAGHFPTEIIMVDAVVNRLQEMLGQAGYENCQVSPCRVETEPFLYCRTE